MSAALVRQALEFVDPDESGDKRRKRGGARYQSSTGQGKNTVHEKNKKTEKTKLKNKRTSKADKDKVTEEVIARLLKLSKPTLDQKVADKIVKRAATGKPVADKVKVKTEKEKSILFPEESFKKFKKQPFCS